MIAYPDHIVPFLARTSEALSHSLTDFAYISAQLINEKCFICGKQLLCIHAHIMKKGKIIKHINIHLCSFCENPIPLTQNRKAHKYGKCIFCNRATEEDPDAIINDDEE